MKSRAIGVTGVEVTEMGLGTAQFGDLYDSFDQDEADAIVQSALSNGIRHFDTAPHYGLGLSECRLGRALVGVDRAEIVVSTKVGRIIEGVGAAAYRRWDFTSDGVSRSLDSSRNRLRLDDIDIAFIHDPDEHVDQAISEAAPALERKRASGEVGAIGVGTKDVATLLRFVRESDIDVVMVAGRLTLLDRTALDELIPECLARGVAVISAGVFNSGILASPTPDRSSHFEYAKPSHAIVTRARKLASIAARHGFTLPEAAVAFARRPAPPVVSVVVGVDAAAQVPFNAALLTCDGDAEGLFAELDDLLAREG